MKESPLATFSRLMTGKVSRWVVIAVWILATAVLTIAWPAVNKTEVNNAPNLSENSPSVEAENLIKKEFPNSSGVPALLTWHKDSGLNTDDLKSIQQVAADLEKKPLEEQTSTPPLHKLPLAALQNMISKDGTTLVQPIFFKENVETDVLEKNLDTIKKQVKEQVSYDSFATDIDAKDKLSTRVTGPVGIQVDATSLFEGADVSLLIATVLLVLILLLVIYRSPILAIIPLIGVGFAYGVLSPILGILADKEWITIDSQSISIMTVLLFGAGTDYCLFLISHYRDELRKVKDKRQALINAFKGASGAIAMFAIIVTFVLPFIFAKRLDDKDMQVLSTSFAIVMLTIYLLALLFKLVTHKGIFTGNAEENGEEPEWGKKKAIVVLGLATIVLAYISEKLVGTIEPVGAALGWSHVFIGIIVVAIVGSAAEYVSAIAMAYNNRMDVMVEISIGSTVQTAMFVAPILVLFSYLYDFLPLVFNTAEMIAMILAALMTVTVVNDGDSNWFEGVLLVGTYIAIGFSFYLL